MRITASRHIRFLLTCLLALAIAGGPLLAGCSAADSGLGPGGATTAAPVTSPAAAPAGTSGASGPSGPSGPSGSPGASGPAGTPAGGLENRIPEGTPSGPLRLACTPKTTLNPLLDMTDSDLSVSQLVYEGLYAIDADGLPQPDLAEPDSVVVAADGRSLSLRLAGGRTFHNGTAVSAHDVAASFDALRAAGPAPVHAGRIPDIIGIIATDDRTLSIYLTRPQPDFAWQLTFPVLPASILAEAAANPFTIIPGTGPYRIDAYTPGKGLTLQAAGSSEAGRKAAVRTIHVIELPGLPGALRAFERDGIDLVGLPPSLYPSYVLRNGLKLERYVTNQYVFLSFRIAEGALLANPARLAFVQAASRDETVLAGLEAQGVERASVPVHPESPLWRVTDTGSPGYLALYRDGLTAQSGPLEQTGATVRQGQPGQAVISGEAGMAYPATRQPLVILTPADDPLRLSLANRLQTVLASRGAAAETLVLPADAYLAARAAGQYDILVAQAVVPGAADPRWLMGQAADPAVAGSELLSRTGMAGYQVASAEVDRLFAGGQQAAAGQPGLAEALEAAGRLGPFTGIGFRYAALASGSRVLGQPRPQAQSLYEGIEDLWLWST